MSIDGKARQATGGCHCGAVRFTVDLPAGWSAHRCNCSYCSMKGNIMIDVPLAALRIDKSVGAMTFYTFNTNVAEHRFCATCGIHVFHKLRSEPDKFGINAVCLDDISPFDFIDLPVHDGRNHTRDTGRPTAIAGMLHYRRTER